MNTENLPIYKSSLDFCTYIELIVRNFDRYHKYTIGKDLRKYAKKNLFLIQKANQNKEKRLKYIKKLNEKLEICKSYEHSVKLLMPIIKQAKAWYKYQSKTNNA